MPLLDPNEGLSAPSGVFLGYKPSRPWLWLTDIAGRRFAPSGTSLPGNDVAISAVVPRATWFAVHTHQTPWSVPRSLAEPGRRLAKSSFTFVPGVDGDSVWIEPPEARRASELHAVDGEGNVVERLALAPGCYLVGELGFGRLFLEEGRRLTLADAEGATRDLGRCHWVHAVTADVAVWTSTEDPAALHVLTQSALHVVRDEAVCEWHHDGSLAPDGTRLALGGYIDPRGPLKPLIDALKEPFMARMSVMAVIDIASGVVTLADGTYPEFAWTPAWSADSAWIAFQAPFKRNRLWGLRADDPELHEWTFKRNPPAPMIEVPDECAVAF